MSLAEQTRWMDAVAQADLVRTGQATASELLDAAAERIEASAPLNAVTTNLVERARGQIRDGLPEGPLTGVPFLLKDLGGTLAGVPETMGSRALRTYVPERTSWLVQRYLDAGLVVAGKTNTPEFGNYCATESELLGPAVNPWNAERSPGGSSGGSAVAVATGVVPAASGGDATGSIRMPSACCGLVGLKPSRGRVPVAPDGQWLDGLACLHVLTRTVRDTALLLDATAGPATGDPYGALTPLGGFARAAAADPGRLRIMLSLDPPFPGEAEAGVRRVAEQVAHTLEGLGHVVERGAPGFGDAEAARHAVAVIHAVDNLGSYRFASQVLGRPVREEEFEAVTWEMVRAGEAVTGLEHVEAVNAMHAAGRRFASDCAGYDVLLCPSLNTTAPPLGTLTQATGSVDAFFDREFAVTGFTTAANITGWAAIQLPVGEVGGMPAGVQLMAPGEAVLLSVAAQLEAALPWTERHPPSSV
jgi:amidase